MRPITENTEYIVTTLSQSKIKHVRLQRKHIIIIMEQNGWLKKLKIKLLKNPYGFPSRTNYRLICYFCYLFFYCHYIGTYVI